ncbi:hypothetical protein C2S51_009035 [Perilla frutescens var. frutescens]|nr:hypothetical protein C2S51_009035 [Perilla frutescens var. frutescens]
MSGNRGGRVRSTTLGSSCGRNDSTDRVSETPPETPPTGSSHEMPRTNHMVMTGSDAASSDHEKIASTCTTIFKRIENPTGFSWKLTPDNIKAKYFDEFRKYFAWPPEWETEVYQVWEAKARVRYSGWLNDMKKKRNNGKPPWINLETWNGLCSYWDTPEVIDRSTKARQNRMSEPDGPGTGISKHRGGSRPVRRLVEDMATQKGISHTQCVYETFRSIHVKKDGTYLTPKDAKIDDRVNDLVAQEGEGADINKIFMRVSKEMQKVKRPRVYGMGSMGSSFISDGSSGSGSTASQFMSHEQCDSRIGSLEEQARQDRERILRYEAQIEEDRKQREELHAQVLATQQMMKEFMTTQVSRRPNDHSDSPSS